jgi:acetylornithine/succinyldiaminopimelate/putrescine aminotransferase
MTNNEIAAKGQEYVLNNYGRFPIAPVKGKGSYLWDANGKQYLDFVGGIAVCILGHCHDELIRVLQEQSRQLWHVSNLYWIKYSSAIAARKPMKLPSNWPVNIFIAGRKSRETKSLYSMIRFMVVPWVPWRRPGRRNIG